MLRRLWCAETGLFLTLWLGLLWFGQWQFLFDPGAFWNTVVGQRILATHDVPHVDEFSVTFAGTPWQSHQWLAQVGMALLHAVAGMDALYLATATLLAATYTWATFRLLRSGCNWMVAAFVLVLLLMGSRYHWLARPQLVTIALLGWTFAQLVDFEAGLVSRRRLYWLPVVFVLWTNLHGGALGGLCTLGFVLVGWCVAWLMGRPNPLHTAADLRCVLLVGIASVLATLVNPYGWELPLGWIRLMELKMLPKYVDEHTPLDWSNPIQRGIVLFGFVYILVLATVPWRLMRVTWLVPIVWFALTLQRIRHCTLFSITAAVALAEVLRYSRLLNGWKRIDSAHETPPVVRAHAAGPNLAWIVPALAVAIALTLQACAIPIPLIGAHYAKIDPALFPTELLSAIRERSKPGDAIFNEMAHGGFLIYYAPELRVYIDDRCELYGDAFLSKFAEQAAFFNDLRQQKKDPEPYDQLDRWTEAHNIRLALVTKGQAFDYYFRNAPKRWKKVAETDGQFSPTSVAGAVLYERVQP